MRPVAELPVPLTAFVGREQELAWIRSLLLDPVVRLLTLTGPPGVGKTRLAIQVAAGAADSFEDVALVALAPLTDPDQVMPAVARRLGVQESVDRSLDEALRAHLGGRPLLLLLDNFEHVLAAGPRLAALLQACPRLTALATSRASLRIYGEHNFPVQPLDLPDASLLASLEEVGSSAAVRLFVACARSAIPDFALTDDNFAAVARLCRRLDGLPLALELAAPRIALFPPGLLLDHLTRSLSLQAGSPRGVPERLRTLRGAIGWSYDLLSHPERVLFGRLSVFVGGCTLETAEAVALAPCRGPREILRFRGVTRWSRRWTCWRASPRWSTRA
jgi:predicted ATPase